MAGCVGSLLEIGGAGNWQEPEGGLECAAGPGVFLHGCWLAEELKTFKSFCWEQMMNAIRLTACIALGLASLALSGV
ncbi:MAG: hypothetical protein ACKPHU_15420, partial [Planctomycetaceae bacterium]